MRRKKLEEDVILSCFALHVRLNGIPNHLIEDGMEWPQSGSQICFASIRDSR
jgi:hypothetical protein